MPTLNTTGFSSVELRFAGHFRQNELGCEYLLCQYWDGSSWASFAFVEDHAWAEYIFLLPSDAGNNPALLIRFQTNAKGKKERAEVDNVEVIAYP